MIPKEKEQEENPLGKETCRVATDSSETRVFSDEYFIEKCFSKSPKEGFDLLFRKYYTNLCNHAIRYVYSKEIAEDIVAEVFANFWNSKAHEHITTSYRSYLYTAVKNRVHNFIKSELNRNTSFDSCTIDFQNYNTITVLRPDEITHFHELSQKLEIAIQHLPKQSQKAFQLNRLEGKKYSEVALEMKLTVSAVERLISRALARIREELKLEYLLTIFLAYLIS
ncbi:RNA polymerase sigma-70 factor [Spirosoma fluviale]|uniref:RNA polymerase sigma-70 factor, ECF subfamily n=1 Tax=Spirosoma fluviale TaxID=1597977 RepID=A0A286FZ58_9BACT|nr:RNA polymerase sigma-70 factor [Spirosoma fluviale]SOD88550.1 RNA polymerase sigma-70 factor, ECF subfamily [Spirosoma fluviale]